MEKYFNINESGNSVRCKIYFNDLKTVKRVVIYGHGFAGHKDNKAAGRFAEHILKKYKDIAIITFNLPCHGDDVRKTLLLDDCNTYINLVVSYAKSRFGTDEIYSYATSFGGYLILKYISENDNPFRKIALRCPAVNMYDVLAKTIMSSNEFKALSKDKPVQVGFDRKIKVNKHFLDDLQKYDITSYDYHKYSNDILILHGTKDEVVVFNSAKEFAENNSIKFIPVENADHRFKDPQKMDTTIKAIIEFFEF
jgi:hypothetical protein